MSKATEEGMSRLGKEIRTQAAIILSDVAKRHEHPTFGVTKTGLRRDLAHLEGMIVAWCYATGRWVHAARVLDDFLRDVAYSIFGIDLEKLRKVVETA